MIPRRLGDLLLEAGTITSEQLAGLLEKQRQTGRRLGVLAVEEGIASSEDVQALLRLQGGLRHVDLAQEYIDPDAPKIINEALARRHSLIPIRLNNGRLVVAMSNPGDLVALDDVRIASRMDIEVVAANRKEVGDAIDRHYQGFHAEQAMADYRQQRIDQTVLREEPAESDTVVSAPMVKFVDSLVEQAIGMQASDIHIEPFETSFRVRFRTDGDLREVMNSDIASHSAIVTRVKIMGNMDIGERRIPQDGRVNYRVDGRDVDMRVSVLPTPYGEKVAIRLLDRDEGLLAREQLGLSAQDLKVLDALMRHPYGMILAAGPTGSGKTTTMYVMLQQLNHIRRNIVTIEDPIEYRIGGVNQTQVNPKAGYTFANGLRSILRQDPDIIMVGEIRDTETAQIAVRAAITGHLVLSTVHTNDAAATVDRLVDMGVEPFLVAGGVIGVIAQRLVKKICSYCKVSYVADAIEAQLLGAEANEEVMLYRGEGCPVCGGTGYRGRTAIVEIMPFSRRIKQVITGNRHADELRRIAQDEGMTTMRENAVALVRGGVTTIDELVRNIYTLDQE